VDMIAALVLHLVRQGTYRSEDIAVITPYLGQLQKIKKRLANSFKIVVGDRDQEELEAKGL
jgi:superfamily I DNA and/or RNA helicase